MAKSDSPHNSWQLKFGDFVGAAGRWFPPELAHDLGMAFLAAGGDRWLPRPPEPRLMDLQTEVLGIGHLAHPLCLAAGFDKDARACEAWFRLGFDMIELGTVTPRPQPGNPKPRLFRYKDQQAIINRMGFNSQGLPPAIDRLQRFRQRNPGAKVGINVGKNKETSEADAIKDFLLLIHRFAAAATYLVVNVSSPNTPGLRGLARPDFVAELALNAGEALRKMWIKFDPDTDKRTFQELIAACVEYQVAGVVLTNTHGVQWPQTGGQSGHPLAIQSTVRLEWAHEVHRGKLPMIASGGVLSGNDVFQKLARGASAVQLWSALVYRGPWAVKKILYELDYELRARGFHSAAAAIGSYYVEPR
jgi:dihydroorotate dehydrogenase